MKSMRDMIKLMEGVMAVPGVGSSGGTESDMQTAGTVGRGQAAASFDAAQPAVDEAREPMYHSVFYYDPASDQWGHQFDADDAEDARLEAQSLRNQGQKVMIIRVPKSKADWRQVNVDQFVKGVIAKKAGKVQETTDSKLAKQAEELITQLGGIEAAAARAYEVASQTRNSNWLKLADYIESMKGRLHEKAPPGEEGLVKDLKKEYPGHEEKAFATAWSIYNKKHGQANESMSGADAFSDPEAWDMADLVAAFRSGKIDNETYERLLTQAFTHDDGYTDWSMRQGEMGNHAPAVAEAHVDTCRQSNPKAARFACAMEEGMMEGRGANIKVHDLRGLDSESAYARTQTDDSISDGDVLVGDGGVGIMYKAWPVNCIGNIEGFESLNPGSVWADIDGGRYEESEMAAQQAAQEQSLGEDMNRVSEDFDLNNGYDDEKHLDGQDYFPNGADSPVVKATGPSGARQGDNPEQKKMQVTEVHKELVYGYRKYLKESKK